MPLDTFNIPSISQFPICSANLSLAVNSLGNVWVTATFIDGPSGIATPVVQVLYEFGTGTSAVPIRTIRPVVGIVALATDSANDLYYLDTSSRLFKALPDGSSPTQILPNVKIVAFTIGAANTIVAEVATSAGLAIETFLPGTTTPLRTIAGPLTKLDPLALDAGGQIRTTP